MGNTGKRILAVGFILIIFFFGGTTMLKAKGKIIKAVREKPLNEIPASIDNTLTDKFSARNSWINVNGLFQRAIGVTVIRDAGDIDVFKMSNGQLTYGYPDNDMTYAAEEVIGLAEYAAEKGLDFVYIQLPCKAYTDEMMPVGTHTYAYADSDELVTQLRAGNVDVLDLRDEIEKEGKDIPSLFFNTDHHWKPSTAIWAAGKISGKLSGTIEGYEYDPAIYDPDNYERTEYEKVFLGSLGRRTGKYFGGLDDFEVLVPKFDVDYEVNTESQTDGAKESRGGDFTEAFLRYSNLEDPDLFSGLTYFTYMGTEYRLARTTNRNASSSNGKKILMLRDSFSCTLLPYLSLSAGEITAIDMRYHKKLKLKDYIDKNDFDAVIIAYNPSMFREDGAFDFDR